MSARSEHLNEEAGLLVCYGKQYDEDDDDCSDCSLSGDCETLTALRHGSRRGVKVAKMPTVRPQAPSEEEQEEEERVPWAVPEEPQVPPSWQAPPQQQFQQQAPPFPQYADQRYMVPVPPAPMSPYLHPGMQCNAQVIPHPAPHLTYMVSNPVDCPMPVVDESWYLRIGKNVLSGVLSESGRQLYEFFRRFRF